MQYPAKYLQAFNGYGYSCRMDVMDCVWTDLYSKQAIKHFSIKQWFDQSEPTLTNPSWYHACNSIVTIGQSLTIVKHLENDYIKRWNMTRGTGLLSSSIASAFEPTIHPSVRICHLLHSIVPPLLVQVWPLKHLKRMEILTHLAARFLLVIFHTTSIPSNWLNSSAKLE